VHAQQDTLTIPLWDEIGTLVVRYRGRFPRKSRKQRKLDNIKRLNDAINGEWQNAKELSMKTGIRYFEAFKLLQTVLWNYYDIEVKEEEWIDERYRQRKRRFYRKKAAPMGLYATIFGVKVPAVPCCEANTRRHVCRDD
jgi:hypothetical protein